MFDQQDYYSDEEQNLTISQKKIKQTKQNIPSSGLDFNHLTGQGESLLKMMKERGFDLSDNEVKKIKEKRQFKSKQKQQPKSVKPKSGYFDGGSSASLEQLIKALKKALSHADPQQASCILSFILDKKNLSPEDRNKFGIMKCNLLFGLGAYEDCKNKALQLIQNPLNKLSAAILSNLIAKSREQLREVLIGYFDLLRAKSLIKQYKQQVKLTEQSMTQENQHFGDSELDTTIRQISHTQLQYNIKLSSLKNSMNMVHPFFPELRNRKINQIACGDYHALFLVGEPMPWKDQKIVKNSPNWATEVFGIGENTVGQILGKQTQIMYDTPIIIAALSGKGIEGISASKESSLAYDLKGNIYQWGVKDKRNNQIQITYSLGERISKIQKGYKHYAVMTESKCFFTWGSIYYKDKQIIQKTSPHLHTVKNITNFSCGNNHILVVQGNEQAYAMGSNEYGQLGIQGQLYSKEFKIINKNKHMGDLQKVFCFGDCTFFVNSQQQIFYSGKFSYEKPCQQRPRQAEFPEELGKVVNMSGTIGYYYLADCRGSLYHWDVDSTVKFKICKEEKFQQRTIHNTKSLVFRNKSDVQPKLCRIKSITSQMKTYQPITYQLHLFDRYGPYGNKLNNPLRCQVFMSTYPPTLKQLLKENDQYLENLEQQMQNKEFQFEDKNQEIILNEIIESRLLSCNINRSQVQSAIFQIKMQIERAGKYYFYVLLEKQLLFSQQVMINASQREQQLQDRSKLQRQKRIQQRKKRAEAQKQRLLAQKLKKQAQQQQRKKETQKRAEQALKKHLKQQQQGRQRAQQQRKNRADLQTGGGFDLSKLKRKSLNKSGNLKETQSKLTGSMQKQAVFEKTGQSFLPDINTRPSSRKKINLPKPSQIIALSRGQSKELQKSKQTFMSQTPSTLAMSNGFKGEKTKAKLAQNFVSTNLANLTSSSTGRGLLKRGLSKGKKN